MHWYYDVGDFMTIIFGQLQLGQVDRVQSKSKYYGNVKLSILIIFFKLYNFPESLVLQITDLLFLHYLCVFYFPIVFSYQTHLSGDWPPNLGY